MQTVRRLVPNFIIEKFKANELRGTLMGAAIFVDLSGFSKMTDALTAHGQSGAEALADLMRVVFEPLVNAVYERGGFVIGYAGDAFNAIFPEDQTPGQETMCCLSALVAIQEHMRTHRQVQTPYGAFDIFIKAGMGFGETRWQMFKSNTGKHLTYWMRGDSLNRAVAAEERARPGDILVGPNALERIKTVVETEFFRDTFRITKILAPLPGPGPITEPEPDLTPMNIFFPEALLIQPIIGEFRHVINVFIDIPLNISDEALVTPFMETVYALQEKYGGFFLRPDLGDKGFNLLMFWGAPVARERDIERALNFVMELATLTNLSLQAGITYRTAYAGFIGAPLREDYTAYGWGVNLAARLMEYAPKGAFWLDEESARHAEEAFDVKYLGDYSFKGFSKELHTYQLLGKKTEKQTIYHGQFIGRQAEMETLASFMSPLRKGKIAGLMLVNGEAGIGKSRLVYAFQNSDFFKGFPTQWIQLQTEELTREAFNPFRPWLRKRFNVVDGEPVAANWAAFMHELDKIAASTPDPELASELTRTASILASLANLTQPDTLYETLDAKARYENTLIALSVLFRAESLRKPLVIFLEDAHWLDEDTAAFLSYLMRSLLADEDKQYPIAILTTQRPGDSAALPSESITKELNLESLSSASVYSLAEDVLGKPITGKLGALLDARAEGNPFFAEQILRYLSEENLLILNDDGNYSTSEQARTSLPMDVRTVMIARLDRLTQKVRETVQTASVLGREFIVDVLVEMLRSQRDKMPEYVYAAEQANIWAHVSEINYIFRHALLRDAAYSMQLESRKRDLHALACSAMEEVHRSDLEPYYGEIAYHAEKGNLKDKALQYLTLAGNLAMNAYQNRQAIDYFTRALAFLTEDDLETRFDLLIKRVECLYNIGDSVSQISDLKESEKLARELMDDSLLARALMRQAHRCSVIGDYQNAIQYTSQAKELAQATHAEKVLMDAYIVLPDSLSHTGKITEASLQAEEGLAYARKSKNRWGEAHMLMALGLALLELKGPNAAQKHQEQALILAREVKDRYLEGKALNNLANAVGLAQGDYHAAYEYFFQALSVFQEQGNRVGIGLALANLGWASTILGDYSAAMTYYERSLVFNREQGNIMNEMYTNINLSAATIGQGNAESALDWANKALNFATKARDRIAQGWAYFYLGHAQLIAGHLEEAVKAFSTSIELRRGSGVFILLTEASAGLLQAYTVLGNQKAAQREAEKIYAHMEKEPTLEGAEEPLRIYFALYNFFKQTKDLRTQEVLQKANQLMNEQISKLRSDEAQRIFVENVPWRQALKDALLS